MIAMALARPMPNVPRSAKTTADKITPREPCQQRHFLPRDPDGRMPIHGARIVDKTSTRKKNLKMIVYMIYAHLVTIGRNLQTFGGFVR